MDKPMTNAEIAATKDAQREDRGREYARDHQAWRARHAQIEDMVAQREDAEQEKGTAHDRAVEAFDFRFKDVVSDEQLLRETMLERGRRLEKMSREGQSVQDWNGFYRDIGETVRKRAGMQSGDEQSRAEALSSMRKARGQE